MRAGDQTFTFFSMPPETRKVPAGPQSRPAAAQPLLSFTWAFTEKLTEKESQFVTDQVTTLASMMEAAAEELARSPVGPHRTRRTAFPKWAPGPDSEYRPLARSKRTTLPSCAPAAIHVSFAVMSTRSEERRVGKEGR